ncbi:MAG: class I SAM-dependent methyltransferase [Bacteroidetes bacterium]|nr:class I SAM-dependent methyltransferase [Bacteroidota bacterium]
MPQLINKLRQYFRKGRLPEADPATAYDIWSLEYDNQPDNLMLTLDGQLCSELLATAPVTHSTIADIGCGTGRHWETLYKKHPARLVGFDVSPGMLHQLKTKFPDAETYLLKDSTLPHLPSASCDLLLSTLTVAHIPDLAKAFTEWARVLKPGGQLIITDYHPEALARGGQRTFRDKKQKTIAIRNHVYPLARVTDLASSLNLAPIRIIERRIDASMRPWYEQQGASAIFERFLGVPIIYGMQLKRVT